MLEGKAIGGPRDGIKLGAPARWDGRIKVGKRYHASNPEYHPGRYEWDYTRYAWTWIEDQAPSPRIVRPAPRQR